jgi:hypothetical protein
MAARSPNSRNGIGPCGAHVQLVSAAALVYRWWAAVSAMLAVSALAACAESPIPDMPGKGTEVAIERVTTVEGHRAVRLSNGRTVLLQREGDGALPDWYPPLIPPPPPPHLHPFICSQPPFRTSVNLSANQTPVRNQGGRNTCTVFAFTAALEAAYHRLYGVTLDLSEQYLNHVQKAFWLNFTAPLPAAEIQPETNGGGNLPWHAGVLERYGLPPASVLPYIDAGDYENTPGGLDAPNLTQRVLDDFDLSSTQATYAMPEPLTTTVLPQAALETARYRPTRVTFADGSQVGSLDWYRSELSCGHEVMFQVNITSTWSTANGLWTPGTGGPNGSSHAMLIVGYDDTRDAFLVKNSWGGTALIWFSYDWVRQGLITDAGVVLDVAPPGGPFSVWENKQIFMGRWNLDHDGWKGTLDIYRLPRLAGSPSPDLRVGTYFGPDGVARRVNAEIDGNRIDFTIDWNNPDQPATVMQGLKFTGFLFSWDHSLLAGTMLDNRDGNTYGFHAQKTDLWSGTPVAGALGLHTYVGAWHMDHDGWTGLLTIRHVDPVTRAIDGTYHSDDGQEFALSGHVDADPRKFTLAISFGAQPQPFTGFLYGHQLEFGAGTTTWAGIPFGFALVRIGGPNVTKSGIRNGPTDTFDECRRKPYLAHCP